MDYLHQELNLGQGDIVQVALDNPANVMLMDTANFELYRSRKPCHYRQGGYVQKGPYRIDAPSAGKWHVVVDLGGGPGAVRASVSVLTGASVE